MSDFLTNLVMRSFAQTPSVQPVTFSTYAAPEPQIDPVEPVVEPTVKTETVRNTNERKLVSEEAPLAAVPAIQPRDHPEKEAELRQPEVRHEAVVFEEPRVMSKPDQTIAAPVQVPRRIVESPVQARKTTDPLIVEQVIEHVVEKPTVKSIERPTVKTIERPTVKTIERSIVETTETIERPSVTSVERSSIEQSSIMIENTEHVTNSFTTLVPKVTPQPLPAFNPKPRQIVRPADTPSEEQDQASTASPETVINVAIGRIEVRATPAPSRREREKGPKVMTLDDYLQQRSRGAQ